MLTAWSDRAPRLQPLVPTCSGWLERPACTARPPPSSSGWASFHAPCSWCTASGEVRLSERRSVSCASLVGILSLSDSSHAPDPLLPSCHGGSGGPCPSSCHLLPSPPCTTHCAPQTTWGSRVRSNGGVMRAWGSRYFQMGFKVPFCSSEHTESGATLSLHAQPKGQVFSGAQHLLNIFSDQCH